MEDNGPLIKSVALIGVGVIGRGWIPIFVRAGCNVKIYDPNEEQTKDAVVWFKDHLFQTLENSSDVEKYLQRLKVSSSLEHTLEDVGYVQESVREDLSIKRDLFERLDDIAGKDTILASSTSALNVDDFAGRLPGQHRCITAHPFNPPYIVPVVEVMGTKHTSSKIINRAMDFLKLVGQKPVLLNRYVTGYLGNRLQAAVLREAINLVRSGVSDVGSVDQVLAEGLAIRWALLGVFGANHTNADGGIGEYYSKYGADYISIMKSLDDRIPMFDGATINEITKQIEQKYDGMKVGDICKWRDNLVDVLQSAKNSNPLD